MTFLMQRCARVPAVGAFWLLALACAPGWSQGLKASGGLNVRAAAAASRQAEAPQTADFIVAVVNSEPITNQEVRTRAERVRSQLQRNEQPVPPADELQRQVLESLILEKAQVQLATEMGIKIDDAALKEAEGNVARQNRISVEQLHAELGRQGVSVAEFQNTLKQQLMLQRLREREVASRVKVTETDIERFITQKQDNPGADLQINLAQVLVAVPEDADAQRLVTLMARAQSVAEKARSGQDFAQLARQFSDAPERAGGGALGLRGADRYPILFVNATRTLPEGGIAGPVRSPAGFHILKVLEKRVAGLPEPVMTETRARHILLRTSASLSEQAAVAKLAELRQRIVGGQADFGTVAREVSQDGSASDGGNLGWVGPGVFVPEFEEAMNELTPNQVSQPIVSRFGVHLIEVLERREVKLGAREQREQLRQLVRESKLDEAYQKWLEDIRARAYVEMREPPQ